jgi:hypothetical protein
VLRQPAELKPMGMVVAAWFPLALPFSNLFVADFLLRRPGRPDFFFTSTPRRRLKNIGPSFICSEELLFFIIY